MYYLFQEETKIFYNSNTHSGKYEGFLTAKPGKTIKVLAEEWAHDYCLSYQNADMNALQALPDTMEAQHTSQEL